MGRSPLAIDCTAIYEGDNANVLHIGGLRARVAPDRLFVAHVRPWRIPFRAGHPGFTILVDAELINEPRYPAIGCVARGLGYQWIFTITVRWHHV